MRDSCFCGAQSSAGSTAWQIGSGGYKLSEVLEGTNNRTSIPWSLDTSFNRPTAEYLGEFLKNWPQITSLAHLDRTDAAFRETGVLMLELDKEMKVESDSELVRQSKEGGIDAFGKLCQRYERTAIAIALSVLAEWHSAEDAVQSSMLTAFRKLHSLEDDAKFGSWLLVTVRRKAIEMKRQQLPVTSTDFVEKATPLLVDENKDVSAWIDREFIRQLVQNLSEADQLLIGLRYFDGHNYAAIAQILGRPIGSITKQLSRAIKTLEKKVHMEYKYESEESR